LVLLAIFGFLVYSNLFPKSPPTTTEFSDRPTKKAGSFLAKQKKKRFSRMANIGGLARMQPPKSHLVN